MLSEVIWMLIGAAVLLLWKFVAKPMLLMRYYKQFNGGVALPFVPVMGAFAMLQPAYDKYGDMQYPAKVTYQEFPGVRFLITNIVDKVLIDLCDPSLIKEYYLSSEDNYTKLKLTYENMARLFGHGIAFSDGKEWSRKRKIMTSMFHFEFFQRFYPLIEQTVDELLDEAERVGEMKSMELGCRVAGQVVVKCFFGGDLAKTQLFGEPICVALSNLISLNTTQNNTVWYMLFGAKFFDLGLRKIDREINSKIRVIRAIGRDTINSLIEKYSKEEHPNDTNFVKMAIDKGYLNGKQELHISTEELIDEFFTFFIGGMDTTSHLMALCLYYIAINPEVQEKLRKEVMQQELSMDALIKLPYLDSVVNETNRHYGFMLSIFPRVAIRDHQLGDLTIKKNTVVMFNWLGNFYNQKYFEKPMDFNPDRWTDGGKAVESEYVFIPFSSGKRVCIGKRLALLETKLLIAKTVRRFRVTLKEGYVHKMVQRNLYQPEHPIPLRFEKA